MTLYSVDNFDNFGWISVNTGRPAESCLVLVLVEFKTGEVRFDMGGIYEDGKWLVNNDWYEGTEDTEFRVTFWRPLPPPPACYEETLHYEL